MIKTPRYTAALLMILLLLSVLFVSGCKENASTLLSNDGEVILSVTNEDVSKIKDLSPDRFSYAELSVKEAAQIIADIDGISEEQAAKKLTDCGYRIETFFDAQALDTAAAAYQNSEISDQPFACALTDNEGHLIAAFSSENEEQINYASLPLAPYSTLKPLSVYAPAIEKGLINWSSVFEDSPYKQLDDGQGNLSDWPENAEGTYSNKNVTVCEALRKSLNTVAVKVLSDYGVTNSIELMEKSFSMPLDFEYQKAVTMGEEEVIGNIAMGYLYEGLSPVKMSGYYSVFATGGYYAVPKTIKKITSSNGKLLYEAEDTKDRVFSEETACVMNQLLQSVTKPGATGFSAGIDDTCTAGKTGTGSSNDGHWFVGTVPQYSCAVWHGGIMEENFSPALFKEIISSLPLDKNADYPYCGGVIEQAYCAESGLLATDKCKDVQIGYYFADDHIGLCNIHN